MELYDELQAAACRMDRHESDLYVEATPTAREIVKRSGRSWSAFVSQVDGKLWLEVPFAWAPFWRAKAGRA